jgi:putative ABC transport system permease protein
MSGLRHTLRLLLKSPGFTITAVLILGLGIGANTAIFSLINSVLLKPLPYPRSDRLVEIFQPLRTIQAFYVCYPDYFDFCAAQHSFTDLAATCNESLIFTGQGDAAQLEGAFVTGNYFRTLGRAILMGNAFGPETDRPDTAPVAVLGEHLWRNRFHSDPTVVGTHMVLGGVVYQIVGVTAQRSDETAEVYLPFNFEPDLASLKTERARHSCRCFGRLKDDVTLQQAQADLEVTSENLRKRFPDTHATVTVRVAPLLDSVVGDFTPTLWLVGASVGLLLVIACANIAGLNLARGLQRQKEMTIRTSLGASKSRLVWQLLGETMAVVCAAAIAGFFLAQAGVASIRWLAPSALPRLDEIHFDVGAFLLVAAVTTVMSVLSGLFPALTLAKTNLASTLRGEGGLSTTVGPQRQRLQHGLIIFQVALASLLLFGCVLLARSLHAVENVSLGFDPRGLSITDIYLPDSKYGTISQRKAFFDYLMVKVGALPGVKSVGLTDVLPFSLEDNQAFAAPFGVTGQPEPDKGHRPRATVTMISSDYFHTLGMPILEGRGFDAVDVQGENRVVIVSRALADAYFPGQDPIGKQIYDFGEIVGKVRSQYTIIGVVPTIYQVMPAQQRVPFQAYYPFGQPFPFRTFDSGTLVVRTDGNSSALIPEVQKILASMDPDAPLSNASTFDGLIGKSFATRELTVLVVSLFSIFALTLSLVGVYAVLARLVSVRTREIGIRVTLGAQIVDVFRIVFGQGIKIVALGLVLGIAGGLLMGQYLVTLLYGITSYDPVTIALVMIILGLAATLACLLPTLRAVRINPIMALKE